MTDNEIIKALECCVIGYECPKDCPYMGKGLCVDKIRKDALDLINRQKAELDKLAEEYGELIIEKDELFDIAEKQKAEIERVRTDYGNMARHALILIGNAQTEAIKEFADKFKKTAVCGKTSVFRFPYYQISKESFDNLVKEMVGDDNG